MKARLKDFFFGNKNTKWSNLFKRLEVNIACEVTFPNLMVYFIDLIDAESEAQTFD